MSRTYMADDTIRPCRFVTPDGTKDNRVVEADANSDCCGISQEGGNEPPIPSEATVLAAEAGEPVLVFTVGDECLLELGEDSVAPGALLKSDSDGKGVDIATTGTTIQKVGARAIQGGNNGDKVRVEVVYLERRPALA